jgi:uncharacterized protein
MERLKQGEFTWVDLAAKDLDAQSRFYEGLFGWTHEDIPVPGDGLYRMFALDGATVAGAAPMSPEMEDSGMPSMWNTYIAADDVDAMAARAAELGGKVVMPAMDVMDQGRMAGIQDPTGGTVFFWKAMTHTGAQTFMEAGSVSWSELSTRDPAKAIEFYTSLLGWQIDPLDAGPTPYWQIKIDGTGEGGIMPMPQGMPAEMPAFWLAYFGATDARAATDKAKSLGATVQLEPTEVPGMLIFSVLADPAGATFAILQGLM